MITKISKILLELAFLVVAICIAILIISFTFDTVNSRSGYDTFSGVVDKKELVITSPSFATIEKLDVYEGQLVKEGDELAILKVLIESNNQSSSETLVDNETYKVNKGSITVYAPSDGIVGKVFYAQKSSVKPENEVMVLYPLKSSTVLINDKFRSFDATIYSNLTIQKQGINKNNYPIDLLDTFPVNSQKDGGRTLYATFTHIQDSEVFDNNETVTVLAVKKDKPSNLILNLKNGIIATYNNLISIFKK